MNYQNRTVVITGGAKGIGEATAKLFYDAGANVVARRTPLDTQPAPVNHQGSWLHTRRSSPYP